MEEIITIPAEPTHDGHSLPVGTRVYWMDDRIQMWPEPLGPAIYVDLKPSAVEMLTNLDQTGFVHFHLTAHAHKGDICLLALQVIRRCSVVGCSTMAQAWHEDTPLCWRHARPEWEVDSNPNASEEQMFRRVFR